MVALIDSAQNELCSRLVIVRVCFKRREESLNEIHSSMLQLDGARLARRPHEALRS